MKSLSNLNTQRFYRHFLQGRWFKGLFECCMLTTPDHVVVHHRSQMLFNPFGTYSLVGVNSFSLMLGSVFTQASRCLAFGMFSVGSPQWTIWSQHGDDISKFVQNHWFKKSKTSQNSLGELLKCFAILGGWEINKTLPPTWLKGGAVDRPPSWETLSKEGFHDTYLDTGNLLWEGLRPDMKILYDFKWSCMERNHAHTSPRL